ncbi:MAG: hypothetical protein K5839_03905 [Treponemataceae bacterium]|nr:hypothetical protein [Treponemataceae bacterium]
MLSEETQSQMINRSRNMKLNSASFGILGGFSSIKNVNEKVLTMHYPDLMKNLPVSDYLSPINAHPSYWTTIKESVLYPYLKDATDTTKEDIELSLPERIKRWNKQYL